MERNRIFVLIFLIFFLPVGNIFACGPWFDQAYLVRGSEEEFLAMPEGNFLYEIERVTGFRRAPEDKAKAAENTANVDMGDLKKALKNISGEGRAKDILTYKEVRSKILSYLGEFNDNYYKYEWYGGYFRNGKDDSLRKYFLRPEVKFSSEFPLEFALYMQGALEYHAGAFNKAIEKWEKLLELPKEERHYKSVWAAFMIGKAYLSMRNAETSISYFELTRKYALEGYRDSLNLSYESYGWQALAEYESGDYVSSIHHYLKQMDAASLSMICRRTFELDEGAFEEAVKDDTVRHVLLAWLVSRGSWGFGYHEKNERKVEDTVHNRLLNAIEKLKIKEPVEYADRIAWIFYNIGQFDRTKRWLELSHEQTSLAQWLSAKVMLREGEIEPAMDKLRAIIPAFKKNDEWNVFYGKEKKDIIRDVNTEIGLLTLKRKDYIMAFDILLKGAYWEDVAYIAEKVLTKEELENYLRVHSEDEEWSVMGFYYYDDNKGRENAVVYKELEKELEYLLARRFGRDGNWDKAIAHMPDTPFETSEYKKNSNKLDSGEINLKETLKIFCEHLSKAENSTFCKEERAMNYYEAGLIMRKYGMELISTELDPDWHVFNGQFYEDSILHRFGIISEERQKDDPYYEYYEEEELEHDKRRRAEIQKQRGILVGSEDEEKRVLGSFPSPNRRFHYRYKAADLMWKCAELLSDNDELKAKALYKGGTFLKIRDPDVADKFYKALVTSCRETKLGKEADRLHWFPKGGYED